MLSAYELEREARIAANKKKIEELGICESIAAVQQLADPAKPKPKRKAPPAEPAEPGEIRRSSRPKAEINYAKLVDAEREERAPREPVDYEERIKGLAMDSDAAEGLRAELEAKRRTAEERRTKAEGKKAGPKDSGKGVRVQGGRVYDSTFGVTCHWCRQKTLEAHVTCTHPKCGKSKMPYSFCHKCLKNRHGEDAETAAASGCWVCPACRGSCGPGCVTCCNCGPCRKKALLEPTSQVVHMARAAGFSNVHDYLVHLVTGEKEENIAARKAKAPWGAWLREDGSDASVQTGGAGGTAAEGEGADEVEDEQMEEVGQEEQGEAEAEAEAPKRKPASRKRGKGKAAAAAAAAEPEAAEAAAEAESDKKATAAAGRQRKSGGGKKAKAAAAAAAEPKAASTSAAAAAAAAATPGPATGSPEDAGAPKADQDAKLSRKARMMQRMGLSPRVEAVAA